MKIEGHAVQHLSLTLAQVCRPERLRVPRVDMFFGPTPLTPRPAILCRLEAGNDLPSAREILQSLDRSFPKLRKPGDEGDAIVDAARLAGWASRLAAGLLQDRLMISIEHGCSETDNDVASFWVEDHSPAVTVRAIAVAMVALGGALEHHEDNGPLLASLQEQLDRSCARIHPNNESRILVEAARRNGLPYLQIAGDRALWQFGWGATADQFWATSSNADGMVGQRMAKDKDLTKRLLRQLGLPTPKWRTIDAASDPRRAIDAIGFPCVVKPFTGGAGKGVTANIRDMATLRSAIAIAARSAPLLLIERHEPGSDYRLMVVDGRLAMAVRRDPPEVEGDGERTVGALIAAMNEEREEENGYLEPVPEDDVVRVTLAAQGLDQNSILPRGQRILLRTNANHATGGTCTNVLDKVHPHIRRMCENLAAATGYRTVGIDYITTDITRSHAEVGGGFIEINSTPGMQVLISGKLVPQNLGSIVVGTTPARIPAHLLLVPPSAEEKLARLIRPQLKAGMGGAAADWAQVGPFRLCTASQQAPDRVAAVLRYRSVQNLVILWTADTLGRFGMPVDSVDRTIILGGPPSDEWTALLRERSGSIVHVDTPAEAAAIALGSNRRTGRTRD